MSKINFTLDTENVVNKELLSTLDEIVNCNICKNIVWNPVECSKCEHIFCKKCIENWLIQSHSCPFKCSGMIFKESRLARTMLSNIYFKCLHCSEILKYEEFYNHSITLSCQENKNKIKFKGKFDKYSEVEIVDHEHTLIIIKDTKMREKSRENLMNIIGTSNDESSNIDNLNNNSPDSKKKFNKYFWTCSLCKRNFGVDIKSAFCEQCGYELCEECIENKECQWLLQIVI